MLPSKIRFPCSNFRFLQRELDYCQWYNGNTCCGDGSLTADLNFPFIRDCPKPSPECEELLTFYQCRVCSPDYTDYLDSNGRLRICESFGDKMYSACKDSRFFIGGECILVKDFESTKQFVEEAFPIGQVYTNEEECFNAAQRMVPSLLAYFTLICSLIIVGRTK